MKDNFRVHETAELAIPGSVLSSWILSQIITTEELLSYHKILPNMPESSMHYQMALDTSSIDKINQS